MPVFRAILLAALVASAQASFLTSAETKASSSSDDEFKLPEGFLIGAGTSAIQSEGAWNEDGKGESQADHLFNSGKLNLAASNRVAADSYHRFQEDVDKAKELGLQVFRLSLSWSRILPTGNASAPNPMGVSFYHKFIDAIIEAGMQPFITLYHCDHPQVLQDEFLGWDSNKMIPKFVEFADFAFSEYGDKVKLWTTINEPNFYCVYFNSLFVAAGMVEKGQLDMARCLHNLILAHMRVYRSYKKNFFEKQQGKVGGSTVIFDAGPASNSAEDIYAAEIFNQAHTGYVLHPIVYGDYPSIIKPLMKEAKPIEFTAEERENLIDSTDFIAINVYGGYIVSYTTETQDPGYMGPFAALLGDLGFIKFKTKQLELQFNETTPNVMHRAMLWIWQQYRKPIIVSENGYGGSAKEGLQDHQRSVYHSAYIRQLVSTVKKFGVDFIAYVVWSLIDSYEWSAGYSRCFGIVHVDYEGGTLNRTLKESSKFFQELSRTRVVPYVAPSSSSSSPLKISIMTLVLSSLLLKFVS